MLTDTNRANLSEAFDSCSTPAEPLDPRVTTDDTFAAHLEASLKARAFVWVGHLLGASERGVLADVMGAWDRIQRLLDAPMGLAPFTVFTESVPTVESVVGRALRYVDSAAFDTEWLRADAALRGLCAREVLVRSQGVLRRMSVEAIANLTDDQTYDTLYLDHARLLARYAVQWALANEMANGEVR